MSDPWRSFDSSVEPALFGAPDDSVFDDAFIEPGESLEIVESGQGAVTEPARTDRGSVGSSRSDDGGSGDGGGGRDAARRLMAARNLLRQDTVAMTVLAQKVRLAAGVSSVVAQVPVPSDRLQRGPRNHRFHVVDATVGANHAEPPALLHTETDPWVYRDPFADSPPEELEASREFRAQNVFAIAASTLALFERHLGRPIPWESGWPQLYLLPAAELAANARYSRQHNGVLFGWLPATAGLPAVRTALSFDVVAHEVSHAVLDGLRPRYTKPGLPDQLAFHEALADVVAMLSLFDLKGVAARLLDPAGVGRVRFDSDRAATKAPTPDAQVKARFEGRADYLKQTPLAGLAEGIGSRTGPGAGGMTPLRRSVTMTPTQDWMTDPAFRDSPHRLGEVLAAAFMQTLVTMWAARLEPLANDGGLDTQRVAEEGIKSARHLLGMLMRALDYLPPVELEFADVIDSVITADKRLSPVDEHNYRGALAGAFSAFGIIAPAHQILDEDGTVAPAPPGREDSELASVPEPPIAAYPPDPDAPILPDLGLRYEHLNFAAFRTSPEEVYQFIWSNATLLGIDVRFATRVERVIASTRVGPDGLVVTEVLADYVQTLRTTAGSLPPGIDAPEGMDPVETVELWGGGVLVFDQFGRFRLHQRKPLLDHDRQTKRLAHLFRHGLRGRDGSFGASDGTRESERFRLLHDDQYGERW